MKDIELEKLKKLSKNVNKNILLIFDLILINFHIKLLLIPFRVKQL